MGGIWAYQFVFPYPTNESWSLFIGNFLHHVGQGLLVFPSWWWGVQSDFLVFLGFLFVEGGERLSLFTPRKTSKLDLHFPPF